MVLFERVCFFMLCAATMAHSAWNYTDDLGRNRALVFSAAVYGDYMQAQTCLDNRVNQSEIKREYTITCDLIGSRCRAIFILSYVDKAAILAFEGSTSIAQSVAIDLDFTTYLMTTNPLIEGRIFTYFSTALTQFWDKISLKNRLKNIKEYYPDYELWTVGYSFGGVMASLIGMAAVKEGIYNSSEVRVITLGQPRIGNKVFAEAHDRLVPNTYRIVHDSDPTPQKPKCTGLLGLGHAFHHGTEVLYRYPMVPNGNFTVINGPDSCQAPTPSGAAGNEKPHLMYFEKNVETFYLSGCV